MKQVKAAAPYIPGHLGSFGKASGMLLCQHNFPNEYSDKDRLLHEDSDRLRYQFFSECLLRHTGHTDIETAGIEHWLRGAEEDEVLEFVKDALQASPSVNWTGCRVLGTVNHANGHVVWGLGLFAKHPESNTAVFTGADAPNVEEEQPA